MQKNGTPSIMIKINVLEKEKQIPKTKKGLETRIQNQICNTKKKNKKNRSKYKIKEDTGSDDIPNSNISGQIVRIRKSQNLKRNMSWIFKETTILVK